MRGYRGFYSLVAHEFFHLWNVKRIRPDALVRRLPDAVPERPLRALVKHGQRPIARLLDRTGCGTYMTAYATPSS